MRHWPFSRRLPVWFKCPTIMRILQQEVFEPTFQLPGCHQQGLGITCRQLFSFCLTLLLIIELFGAARQIIVKNRTANRDKSTQGNGEYRKYLIIHAFFPTSICG